MVEISDTSETVVADNELKRVNETQKENGKIDAHDGGSDDDKKTHQKSSNSKSRKSTLFMRRGADTTDSIPKNIEYSDTAIIFTIISLGLYVFDIISDINVACLLKGHGYNWWFALTLTFVIIPSFIVNSFSLRFYNDDEKSPRKDVSFTKPPRTRNEKIILLVAHLFGFGPAYRYVYLIIYGLRLRRLTEIRKKKQIQEPIGDETKTAMEESYSEHNYEAILIYDNRDACMLSLIESFLEGAPQLILQIYILIIRGIIIGHESVIIDIWQTLSIISSITGLAWGLAAYQRALRLPVEDKKKLSRSGQMVMFLWQLGMISSRVFALALFASHFKYWLAPLFVGHWGIMTTWLIHLNTDFCMATNGKKHQFREYLYDMVMGVVYIFCFVNAKESHTRYKYAVYYTIMFVENIVCVSLWYHYSEGSTWYHKPAIAWVILSFIGGLTCMLIYYAFLHPNGPTVIIIRDDSNQASPEKQTLFSVCCGSALTSQSTEDNSTPLEPTNQEPSVFVIKENEETKEDGL